MNPFLRFHDWIWPQVCQRSGRVVILALLLGVMGLSYSGLGTPLATCIFLGVLLTFSGFSKKSMAKKIADTFEIQICFVLWLMIFLFSITHGLESSIAVGLAFCAGLTIWPLALRASNEFVWRPKGLSKILSWLLRYQVPLLLLAIHIFLARGLFLEFQNGAFDLEIKIFKNETPLSTIMTWHSLIFFALFVPYGRLELATIAYVPILLATLVAWFFGISIHPLFLGCLVALNLHIIRPHLNAYKFRQPVEDIRVSLTGWLYAELVMMGFAMGSAGVQDAQQTFLFFGLGISLMWFPSLWCIRKGFALLSMGYNRRGFGPITFRDLFAGVFTLSLFILASFSLSGLVPPWRHLPLSRANKKFTVHWLVSKLCRFILNIHFTTTQRDEGLEYLDFSQPRLLMANHQSHIDLVMILKLHPKIIVLTNEWVWKNIFYGTIVRYLDYIPSHLGLEKSLVGIRDKIKQGYSVLVFPEGTRTPHGKIQRYRQGAFQLAHALNLPIQPILIHGAHDCLPKREFYLHPGQLSLKVFPVDLTPVVPDENNSCGPVAKTWTQKMRQLELAWKNELEVDSYYSPAVLRHYLYKGPVLEWYLKIKLQLEQHYQVYHEVLPKKGFIVDMGCGYGLALHHLKMRSVERQCLGVDVDVDKIGIAQGVFMADRPCEFSVANLNDWLPPPAEAYMFNDVLHYLPKQRQFDLLNHCVEHLSPTGVILIREADEDDAHRTEGTRWTELWSTQLLSFNCHDAPLCYLKGSELEDWGTARNMTVERGPTGSRTSNTMFILRPNENKFSPMINSNFDNDEEDPTHVTI